MHCKKETYPTHFLTLEYNKDINYFKLIIQKIACKKKIICRKKFQAPDRISCYIWLIHLGKSEYFFQFSILLGLYFDKKHNYKFPCLNFIPYTFKGLNIDTIN